MKIDSFILQKYCKTSVKLPVCRKYQREFTVFTKIIQSTPCIILGIPKRRYFKDEDVE